MNLNTSTACTWNVRESAARLHQDALVCDFTLPYTDLGSAELKRQLLPRYIASGVDFVSLSIAGDSFDAAMTVKMLAQERGKLAAAPDRYLLVETADDIVRAKRSGLLAVSFDIQGTMPLDEKVEMVEIYYRLGVRHMLMAYNARNAVGDGCMEPGNCGLSLFGKRVVSEMNRVGMLVDCAHTGRRTSLEVMELSTSPVIFSHANVAAVHPHPRNLVDEQIDACARTGGVIGILGVSNMLNADYDASPARLVEHVDYIVQRAGPDHVGLALDYVYDQPYIYAVALSAAGGSFPAGSGYRPDMPLTEPEQYPKITETLLDRGYKEDIVRKILGENWLRVARRVWK
jgi:membrane dipeptidase